MNKLKINLFEREFSLDVYYDNYGDEEVTEVQKAAFEQFKTIDFNSDKLLNEVKKYCLKRDKDEIEEPITNIFKYVIPQTVYVVKNDEKRIVALLCNYRFDPEHGIAIVFENEKLANIGMQDCIL